ncbi:MAG TPA: hypothetical protein VHN19_06020 [Burkholderiales bacterium]|jgi:hypothetical protein|nr:hypothetical protein [Burkholderiales bacterium]
MKLHHAAALLLLASTHAPGVLASCGSAFCTINTSWDVQGAWTEPGARFDLRYEAVNQTQPRTGTTDLSVGQIPRHHDEVLTRNRNWIGTFDYTFDADWGVSASLPLVDRSHDHIHNHMGGQIPESWDFRAVGDLRVLGRRRIGDGGINFGVKLPTGKFNVANGNGDLAERTLQPGTGTTDLLVGGYYAGQLSVKDLSWFAQTLLQVPLNYRDAYRPGSRLSLDTGLRYDLGDQWSAMLQLNILGKARDRGANAEPEDTGGTSVWIGPGVSYAATRDVRLYGFVQVPLYQYVNGVQLVANKAVVLGLSARF